MKKLLAVALVLCLLVPCAVAENGLPFGFTGEETYTEAVEKMEAIWGPMTGEDDDSKVYDEILDTYITVLGGKSVLLNNAYFNGLPCTSVIVRNRNNKKNWVVNITCSCDFNDADNLIKLYDWMVQFFGKPTSASPEAFGVSLDGERTEYIYYEHPDLFYKQLQTVLQKGDSFYYTVMWKENEFIQAGIDLCLSEYRKEVTIAWGYAN